MPAIQAKIVGDFCNLRCTYCRDRDFDQGSRRVMKSQTLKSLLGLLSELPDNTQRMHWLGGEPTLAGLDLFYEAMGLQNSVQGKRGG